jgi:TolB protein
MMKRIPFVKTLKLLWIIGLLILLLFTALSIIYLYLAHFVKNDNSSVPDSTWQTYSNPFFGISLEYPSHWQHVDGEAQYGERYAGDDGYFTFSAMRGGGLNIDLAAIREAQHKLLPYGPDPIIEEISVQTQDARLITPSDSQDDFNKWGAALLVMYPQPVIIKTGSEQHHYPIFVLYSDPTHIRGIAASLKFDENLVKVSEATEVPREHEACQSISEIKTEVCWPSTFSIIQITEHNRRGSFKAYGFHVNGLSQTPYLSEIQFFSEESIATFTNNCGGDSPCFFGDYPDLDRFAELKSAFEVRVSYQDYALKRFGGRDFFVKNVPCYGDDCVIREYTTFLGDVMVAIWIVLEDESQGDLSDQIFNQLVFVPS